MSGDRSGSDNMKIEKIAKNTIKVTLTFKDFERRNIDVTALKFNSPAYQDLLWDIIDHAEIEMGLEGLGDRILVETVSDKLGNCIITITRSDEEEDTMQEGEKADPPTLPASQKAFAAAFFTKLHQIYTEGTTDSGSAQLSPEDFAELAAISEKIKSSDYDNYIVLRFEDFDRLVDAVLTYPKVKSMSSQLYLYRKFYYLILRTGPNTFRQASRFEDLAGEYDGITQNAEIILPILKEHGKILMKRGAVPSILRHFGPKGDK